MKRIFLFACVCSVQAQDDFVHIMRILAQAEHASVQANTATTPVKTTETEVIQQTQSTPKAQDNIPGTSKEKKLAKTAKIISKIATVVKSAVTVTMGLGVAALSAANPFIAGTATILQSIADVCMPKRSGKSGRPYTIRDLAIIVRIIETQKEYFIENCMVKIKEI